MGSILVELDIEYVNWVEDDETTWENGECTWESGSILRTSARYFIGDNFYSDRIKTITPPQFKTAFEYGGYCKLGFGDIEFIPTLFSDNSVWPPPANCNIDIYYTDTTEAARGRIFSGSAYRASITRTAVLYELFDQQYDNKLLEEVVDYNGDTVSIPKPFGTIAHQQPLRLPDQSGKPLYHNYLAGTCGVDWYCYDDGVDISSNVTENGNNTFTLSVSAVGEVTVSGTADETTLDEVFEWACEGSRLNITSDVTKCEAAVAVNCWVSNQQRIVNFLSELSAYNAHFFYLSGTTLYLIEMDTTNGTATLTNDDHFPNNYTKNPPVAELKASWVSRSADTNIWIETKGYHITETDHEVSRTGFVGGTKIDIKPYDNINSNIKSSLNDIYDLIMKDNIEVPVPLSNSSLPVPGKQYSGTDTSMSQDLSWTVKARNIKYDLINDRAIITGEGTIGA